MAVTYSPEIAESILERLAAGESLREICQSENMPSESAVRKWVQQDTGSFGAQYTRVRDIGLDCQNDYALAVAKDPATPVDRARLIVETLKWRLAKMAPKRYGDRLELAGDAANPLTIAVEYIQRSQVDRAPDGIIDARPARALSGPESEE